MKYCHIAYIIAGQREDKTTVYYGCGQGYKWGLMEKAHLFSSPQEANIAINDIINEYPEIWCMWAEEITVTREV